MGFLCCAQCPVQTCCSCRWDCTSPWPLSIKKGFLCAVTRTQRANNFCTLSAYLCCSGGQNHTEAPYSRKKFFAPNKKKERRRRSGVLEEPNGREREDKKFKKEKKKKKLNNLFPQDLACYLELTETHRQNSAQTEACQLAM